MKFDKKPPPRTDDESGADARTLCSSAESEYSYGPFGGQYSDTTDCEPSSPTSRTPNRTRGPLEMGSRSTTTDNVRTPLLQDRFNYEIYGYTKVPDSQTHQDHHDISFTDVELLESSYKINATTKNKQSSLVTIFAVWNTIMGSSLLTMAWGIERAGLLTGVLLTVMMGGLCFFTAYTLLNVCYHHSETGCFEAHTLSRILLGHWAEVVARVSSLLVMLGANIVYWMLMTNFLYYSVKYFSDIGSVNVTRLMDPSFAAPNDGSMVICPKDVKKNLLAAVALEATTNEDPSYWGLYTSVPLYVSLVVFPLMNFRNATFFTKFNSLGTLSVLYLVVFVVVKGWAWGIHVPTDSMLGAPHMARDAAILSGMLALSFYIHNIIITIMRNNKHQHNNGRDLCISFSLVTVTYVLVGAVFYVCFPLAKNCIEDNILNNFAKGDVMSAVARILLFFQVVTVYPLVAYMFREQILELIPNHHNTYKRWRVITINAATVGTCIMFSCFCPGIGNIIRFTGALSGLVHVFALPAALQAKSLYLRGKLTIVKAVFYLSIFVLGTVNLFAQFFVSNT